ncbi:unnamed protein product [Ilex paraguariensis]|uniref:Bifunctional inhibitor/plant lipid transfer protein/seed storage helical domain-containing protein n=1 Tax=Ilex paraguariensis TaxID=185542 RepID=A0ABC8ULK1_9AQUA
MRYGLQGACQFGFSPQKAHHSMHPLKTPSLTTNLSITTRPFSCLTTTSNLSTHTSREFLDLRGMGSKNTASLALFLAFNLLFFTFVSACGTCPTPNPKPKPKPNKGTCPRDALKLGVCADLLRGLLNIVVGTPPKKPCCSLLGGLADLEAAVCLCTAIKANVLGINLNVPLSLSLLLNVCGKKVPSGFKCA